MRGDRLCDGAPRLSEIKSRGPGDLLSGGMAWLLRPFSALRPSGARPSRGAVWAAAARVVLLVALIASGVVPQGMMRVAGAEGARLVLCTGEGPREIWMAADGSVSDEAPLPSTNHEVSSCLAVSLSLAGLEMPALPDFRPAERAPEPVLPARGLAPMRAPDPAHGARAPPRFV